MWPGTTLPLAEMELNTLKYQIIPVVPYMHEQKIIEMKTQRRGNSLANMLYGLKALR